MHLECRLLADGVAAAEFFNHWVPAPKLSDVMGRLHAALVRLARDLTKRWHTARAEQPSSAQFHKSLQPAGIVGVIDGKTRKRPERHLTGPCLDPKRYRRRHGLPVDDLSVAPATPSSAPPSPRRWGRDRQARGRDRGQAGAARPSDPFRAVAA
ncbi:MucR family transcriptional regulator [Methylobacterium sp. A49B]